MCHEGYDPHEGANPSPAPFTINNTTMQIINSLAIFGQGVYEIECDRCHQRFYFDKAKAKNIEYGRLMVYCIGCPNHSAAFDELFSNFETKQKEPAPNEIIKT